MISWRSPQTSHRGSRTETECRAILGFWRRRAICLLRMLRVEHYSCEWVQNRFQNQEIGLSEQRASHVLSEALAEKAHPSVHGTRWSLCESYQDNPRRPGFWSSGSIVDSTIQDDSRGQPFDHAANQPHGSNTADDCLICLSRVTLEDVFASGVHIGSWVSRSRCN